MFRPCFRSRLSPIVLALFTLAGFVPVGPGAAQNPPTVDKITAMFDDVVFGSEFFERPERQVIAKWDGPLRVSVKGEALDYHLKYLRTHLKTVIELTGLTMEAVDTETARENVTISFIPANMLSKVRIETVDPSLIQRLAGPRSCYFVSFRPTPETISRNIIIVNKERRARDINHCLLEEVLQGLGFPNDSNLIRPSVFSDHDQITTLSRSDEIIVRTLYDPRLKPGTERNEALRVARTIIEELDATLPRE